MIRNYKVLLVANGDRHYFAGCPHANTALDGNQGPAALPNYFHIVRHRLSLFHRRTVTQLVVGLPADVDWRLISQIAAPCDFFAIAVEPHASVLQFGLGGRRLAIPQYTGRAVPVSFQARQYSEKGAR